MKADNLLILDCAECGKPTNRLVELDANGEWIAWCIECGRFLKYPSGERQYNATVETKVSFWRRAARRLGF